jgi:hypothetical protein
MRRSMPEKFRSYLTLFDWCKSGVINVYVARFLPSDQRSSAPIPSFFHQHRSKSFSHSPDDLNLA